MSSDFWRRAARLNNAGKADHHFAGPLRRSPKLPQEFGRFQGARLVLVERDKKPALW